MSIDFDDQYATQEEALESIKSLSDADHVKLRSIAEYFAHRRLNGKIIEPRDLLQQAFMKTLTGDKRWRKKVPFIKHLDRCMENISGHIVEKYITNNTESLTDYEYDVAAPFDNPVNRISAVEQIENTLDIFKDDKIARDLLELKSQGFSAVEIQRKLGIGKTQYETVTRRISRHITQYFRPEVLK